MGRLLLLFIVLPAVELGLLIELGARIGTLATLALIVVTGVVGASMARSQGLRVIRRIQEQIGQGEMPADSLIDGLMILVASALLVTPGVLTDVFGFLCLIPSFRTLVKREAVRRFKKAVEENRIRVNVKSEVRFGTSFETGGSGSFERGPASGGLGRHPADAAIDVTPESGDRSH